MKKAFTLVLTILVLFNFINTSVFADEDKPKDTKYQSGTVDFGTTDTFVGEQEASKKENWEDLLINGSATVEETKKTGDTTSKNSKLKSIISTGSTGGSGLLKLFVSVFSIIPQALNWMVSGVTGTTSFTINELLSNQYDLTDIKFWEEDTKGERKDIVNPIRENVAIWYYSLRNIAAVAMVVILIYIGIRIVLLQAVDEASAKQRARYKQMITDWFIGLALLLVLHVLMIALISVTEIFTNMIIEIGKAISDEYESGGIETNLTESIWSQIWAADNSHPFWTFVIYLMLTFYQIKFFITYVGRAFKIYLYIIISPLVCMTYSIDKISDNTSQTFNSWTREFIGSILIQPIQLITYTIFILSANELMLEAPILLVILLAGLSNINKIITNIILPRMPKFTKAPGDVKLSKPGEWFK